MKLRLIFILVAAVSLASCGGENEQTASQKDTIVANDSVDETQQIIAELDGRIANDPNNPNLYHERAFVYYRMADFEKSLNDINRAISIDSSVAMYYFTKAEIFMVQYKIESAKSFYEIALEKKPDYWEAELKLGRIQMYLKEFNKAMEHINKALKINAAIAEAYFMKGEIYEELKDSAKAASSFQTAIEQNPEYYDAYIRLGVLYSGARNPLALEYYNTALEIKPNSMEALYHKAMYCQENELTTEALLLYDQMLQIKPDFELAYFNKGFIYLVYLNNYDMSIAMFDEAIKINPRYYNAYHNRGLANENLKNYRKARDDYKKALEINPAFDLSANALDELDRKGLR